MCCIPNGCNCCQHCCGVDQSDPCPKDCSCAKSDTHQEMEKKMFGFHNQKSVDKIILDLIQESKGINDQQTKIGAIRVLEELERRIGVRKEWR